MAVAFYPLEFFIVVKLKNNENCDGYTRKGCK